MVFRSFSIRPSIGRPSEQLGSAGPIPKYLDEVLSAKAKKNYSSPCWLVIYLNINEYGIRQSQTEQVIAETKARYSKAFASISILWKEKLY